MAAVLIEASALLQIWGPDLLKPSAVLANQVFIYLFLNFNIEKEVIVESSDNLNTRSEPLIISKP